MRPLALIGIVLVIFGIVALAVPAFTFFTTERVADIGFFKIDISRPHTIVLNPVVGGLALAVGIVLVIIGFVRVPYDVIRLSLTCGAVAA